MHVGRGVCVYVCFSLVRCSLFGSPLNTSSNTTNREYQTWVKDAIEVPSYVDEVKGHVELFLCKLLWYWSSSWLNANYRHMWTAYLVYWVELSQTYLFLYKLLWYWSPLQVYLLYFFCFLWGEARHRYLNWMLLLEKLVQLPLNSWKYSLVHQRL